MNKRRSQSALLLPLLETLQELGGAAKTTEVYHALADKVGLPQEKREETIPGGYRYWDRTVRFVELAAKLRGFVAHPRQGVWGLTEKAADFLKNARPGILITVYEVVDESGEPQGLAMWGEMQSVKGILDGKVNLIVTSPPYPLLRPKEYGNLSEQEYLDWFLSVAQVMYDSLTEDGSLVLNLGSVYQKGLPVQSMYQHRLLLRLQDEIGFYLAQEFSFWNPAALPAPVEWVNIRRVRVKTAVENIYWLSRSPYPKADNRRVLVPYSQSMVNAFKEGRVPQKRPSGHRVNCSLKDNGGAIPPNIIVAANSSSTNSYLRYCRSKGIKPHPARFPAAIPEFFIKLCTEPQDIVWDCFGGSGTVGKVALDLGRRFLLTEKSLSYLEGSLGWFDPARVKLYEPLLSAAA